MADLTTSRRPSLDAVPGWLAAGRVEQARTACEAAIEDAQARSDYMAECVARGWLAVCMARRRDFDAADAALSVLAGAVPGRHGQVRVVALAASARVAAIRGEAREACEAWWEAAIDAGLWEDAVEASLLRAQGAAGAEALSWLDRAVEIAEERAVSSLPMVYERLALIAEALAAEDRAVHAWSRLVECYAVSQREEPILARAHCRLGWAAAAGGDWPLAEAQFQKALVVCREHPVDAAWEVSAVAGLSAVQEAAGDVIEARRLLLQALQRGREHALDDDRPVEWMRVVEAAKRLDLSVR